MRHERQIELLSRVEASGDRFVGLHAAASRSNPASAYTSPARFERELDVLFRDRAVFFGMSADLPEEGSSRAQVVGGVPIVVVRQRDGSLDAFVNACRHRGAPLVEPTSMQGPTTAFRCPYHAWTYELSGELRARPASAGAFDDVTDECSLFRRPVAEKHGLVFVRARGDDPIDVDEALAGAEDDLAAFDLGSYTHIETRTAEWNLNWKLFLDTFTESYHIRTLHRDSIAPAFNSDCVIADVFGSNVLSVGLRADVTDEFAKPRDAWSLLPYGTIQYFLVPTGLVVHQLDHVEVWVCEPLAVGRTRTTTSIYAPEPPATERAHDYFVKNLNLLLEVTGSEDFPLMEQIQQTLASGALPEVVYGRVEPPLIHLHDALDAALRAGDERPDRG